MARVARELGPLEVKRLTHPGGTIPAFFSVGGVKGLARKVTAPAGTVVLIHEGTDDPSTRVDLSTNRPRKNCYYLLVQMPETGELVTLAAGCLEPVSAQAS